MAKEALYISEDRLGEVIRVIRAGLKAIKAEGLIEGNEPVPSPPYVRRETAAILERWCREEEAYTKRSMGKEYRP